MMPCGLTVEVDRYQGGALPRPAGGFKRHLMLLAPASPDKIPGGAYSADVPTTNFNQPRKQHLSSLIRSNSRAFAIMSRQSTAAQRNLSLTEELEKLEQSITLTLQGIEPSLLLVRGRVKSLSLCPQ